MPRKARQKSSDAVYHIICRSISEIKLFRKNKDRNTYLKILKKYIEKFKCSIYAYCLMDTHVHLQLDPKGFDISTFMRCVNVAYVRYYNREYKRHGPVFQDRFESRIIDSDRYFLNLSAYIHNNSKDVKGYNGKEHLYPFSSYGIYLGITQDKLGLVDVSFIRSLFPAKNHKDFAKQYREFVMLRKGADPIDDADEVQPNMVEYEYVSGRNVLLRDKPPLQVLSYISERLSKKRNHIVKMLDYKNKDYRAFCAYVLRVLCGLGYREICQYILNVTISGCANLFERGYKLASGNTEYADIFDHLVTLKAA